MRLTISLVIIIIAGFFISPVFGKPAYDSVLIKEVPHVRQKPDFCGEACVEMILRKRRYTIDQDQVFNVSNLDPAKGRGCYARELHAALLALGFKPGQTWYNIPDKKNATQMDQQFKAMHEDLKKGVASIICMRYNFLPNTTEHFRLILGYDSKTDEVIYHEPAEDGGAYKRMKRKDVLKLWPLKSRTGAMLVRMRLDLDVIKKPTKANHFSSADYAQHVLQLRKKLPKGFTVVIQRPFVVVGDESAVMVKRRSTGTVKFAVDRLKKQYFKKDPTDILTIWLFKNKSSYEKYCKKLFGFKPHTPFGFYLHNKNALIMNISTGGGTLVHEIVHPFVAANFPQCPSWFNEGLGSLYEQCGDRNGRIVGYTNWRLAGLQKAIRAGEVPSFKKMTATSDHQFYNMDKGTNYAQARYLCYYLQQKGLLQKYYQQFSKNYKNDPTGYQTLAKILAVKDWAKFQKEWEKWVMKLRYPM